MKTAVLSVAFAILCVLAEAQMGPGRMGPGRMGSGRMGPPDWMGSGRMGPPDWMGSGMMGPGMMGPGMMGPAEMGPDSGKPLIRCKRPMCERMCAYGMRLDEQGCPTCECQADPCEGKKCDDGLVCRVEHCHEFPCKKMFDGVCRNPAACPEVMCMHPCPLGFKINKDGCHSCECKIRPCENHNCTAEQTCVPHMGPCRGSMCDMMRMFPVCVSKDLEAPKVVSGCPLRKCMSNKYCEFGYQVDEKGCRTCSCKDDPCEGHKCAVGLTCAGHPLDCEADQCPTVPVCRVKSLCQHHRAVQQAILMRGVPMADTPHVPECTEDGAFKSTQCHEGRGECWCVDEAGEELDGTRKPMPPMPHGPASREQDSREDSPERPASREHKSREDSRERGHGSHESREEDSREVKDDRPPKHGPGKHGPGKHGPGKHGPPPHECPILRSVSATVQFTMVHSFADITVHIAGLKQAIHEHIATWMMIVKENIEVVEIRPHSVMKQHIVVVVKIVRTEDTIDLPSAVFNLRSKMQQHVCQLNYGGHMVRANDPNSLKVEHMYAPVKGGYDEFHMRERHGRPFLPIIVFAIGAAILVLIVTIAVITMLTSKKRRRGRNGHIPQWKQNLVVGENLAFPNQLYEELDGEKKQPLPADEISVEVPKTDVVA
ncbi:hypothetical protein NP493_385g04000 [Ridgeia piscesae]|uniref:Uncharacterized protein n=1 Tax=Ridgeia piscesae TaxID=27915 RepID=A0AAD9L3E3_RIDPI|nr:hypothetical protein NP493_385g04000 [Ridgeia piscesae]